MLRQFMGNYGKSIVGAFAILCAMLIYQEYRQDVLAYSLDRVGERLEAMASDEKDRSSINQLYEAFKRQVLDREVSPDQVEKVAANILNLNQQGATVTSEQVMAMLEEPTLVMAGFSVPVPPPTALQPERFEELGEKLKTLYEFDTRFQEAIKADPNTLAEIRKHRYYEYKDGLRVHVDRQIRKHFEDGKFERIGEEIQGLERKTLAIWREHVADSLRVIRGKVGEDLAALTDSTFGVEAEIRNQLKALKHLKSLEKLSDFGYRFDEEKLHRMIERRVGQEEKNRETTWQRRLREDLPRHSEFDPPIPPPLPVPPDKKE
ncbi:MAG: hypothetical protein FJY97_12395 [candidate division Zixibacteria bacterium]|nr:hypothetical protein [candidate division Zixibacteria bacterium]